MSRHRRRPGGRRPIVLAGVLAAAGTLVWLGVGRHSAAAPDAAADLPTATVAGGAVPISTIPAATSATPTATGSSSDPAAGPVEAAALDALVAQDSATGTSVAALNVATGASVSAGAAGGMTTASVVKLELLESLLLEHQSTDTTLSDTEADEVQAMIENSDNDAAEAVFEDLGGRPAVVGLEDRLGLSTGLTVPGDGDYWGLTTTGAAQQLVLLGNLVDADSPLDAKGRAYALALMSDVQSDQAWGVSAAADDGTDPALKNGWLAVDDDGGLWAVNSVGVVTVDGDTVLIAVLTQHDADEADGIARVESLAVAAAQAVT